MKTEINQAEVPTQTSPTEKSAVVENKHLVEERQAAQQMFAIPEGANTPEAQEALRTLLKFNKSVLEFTIATNNVLGSIVQRDHRVNLINNSQLKVRVNYIPKEMSWLAEILDPRTKKIDTWKIQASQVTGTLAPLVIRNGRMKPIQELIHINPTALAKVFLANAHVKMRVQPIIANMEKWTSSGIPSKVVDPAAKALADQAMAEARSTAKAAQATAGDLPAPAKKPAKKAAKKAATAKA